MLYGTQDDYDDDDDCQDSIVHLMFSHLELTLTMMMMVRMMMAMMFVKKTTDVSIPRGSRQHQQSAHIIISSNIGPVALIILYLLYQTSLT